MNSTRKFDRIPSNDPRNFEYPVSLLWSDFRSLPPITDRYWRDYAFLDQGPDGACVGFGISGELAADPESVPNIDYTFAMGVYHDAQMIDQWAGEDYEGTSVLAGAKVARNRGYYSSFMWADSEEDMARTVSNFGPVVIGVDWYEGMMDPDSDGYLNPTGEIVGGHCVVVIGINATNDYYTIRNSWGPGWGNHGEAKISRDTMAFLISQNGDVCKPSRVPLDPEPVPDNPEPAPAKCGFFTKLLNWIAGGKWAC